MQSVKIESDKMQIESADTVTAILPCLLIQYYCCQWVSTINSLNTVNKL